MRIIFFGSPPFAGKILTYLIKKKINVVAIVTQPLRYKKIVPFSVRDVHEKFCTHLPLLSTEKASSPSFFEKLEKFVPDLFVVTAFGQILKQNLLDLPKKGCINVHASLLPKYRGAAPIQRCLMAGEKKTGITIMKMVRKMDAGDIIATKELLLDEEMTLGQLQEKLCTLSQPLLLKVIHLYEKGKIKSFPQDEEKVTYAEKILPEECEISWEKSAFQVHNLIRSLSPSPSAYCYVFLGKKKYRLKIKRSKIFDFSGIPGEIIEKKNNFIICCKEKALEILEVQLEGKKTMKAKDFLHGLKENISFYIKHI